MKKNRELGDEVISELMHAVPSVGALALLVAATALGCRGATTSPGASPASGGPTPPVPSASAAATSPPGAWKDLSPTFETNGYGTCIVRASGKLYCWGGEYVAGRGTSTNPEQPFAVPNVDDAIGVSLGRDSDGSFNQCLLRRDGAVLCWGDNRHGQVDPSAPSTERLTPTLVRGIPKVRQVRIMGDSTCVVTEAGSVVCWGGEDHAAPFVVSGLARVAHLSTNGDCAVLADKTVVCAKGSLASPAPAPAPIAVANAAPNDVARVIDMPPYHCAVRELGDPRCWDDAGNAVLTPALAGAVDIEGQANPDPFGKGPPSLRVCFLRRSGTVGCATDARSPKPIFEKTELTQGVALADNGSALCIVQANGAVLCSGLKSGIPVDLHGVVDHPLPQPVSGLTNVVELQAVARYTCARTSAGAVLCWGKEIPGQRDIFTEPTSLDLAGSDASAFGLSDQSLCVVKRTGAVTCRGPSPGGLRGFYGNPTGGFYRTGPLAVPALKSVVLGDEACGIGADGSATCWTDQQKLNARRLDVRGAREALVVENTVCVVLVSGRVACQPSAKAPFKELAGISGVVSLTSDGLALLSNGSVALFSVDPPGLTAIAGVTDARAVARTSEHACAVRANGKVTCWGRNRAGCLGDGGYQDHGPQDVPGIDTATQVACGGAHTCALLKSGQVLCWGFAEDGLLGTGEKVTDAGASALRVVFPGE